MQLFSLRISVANRRHSIFMFRRDGSCSRRQMAALKVIIPMPRHQAKTLWGNCQPLAVGTHPRLIALPAVGFVAICLIVGCSDRSGRLLPPKIDADAAVEALIADYDTNKNAVIDGTEFDRIPAIKSAISKYDSNGDTQVTADEIRARIESWQIVPMATMPISCTVRLNRRPLPGATVVLEPEAPFAGSLKSASGTTDKGGFAQLSIEFEDQPDRIVNGVQCGLYRVRITAPLGGGRELPAKYNTSTQLGLEVAPDAAFMRSGLRFDL